MANNNMPPIEVADPGQSCFTRASLYVGDLHADVTEAMLYEKFSTVGTVLSIRVCRDNISKLSLRYAYVNFQLADDAARALDSLNFDKVHGKPIRIMWSQRDPSLRKSGIGNVFIKNLDKMIDNKAIYDIFAAFGKILSCKIAKDENGVSKGYGFVHFADEQGANKSIDKLNGMLLQGKKVFVGKFIPHRVRNQIQPNRPFNNVYVKNFADELNDELLYDLFQKYGQITSHRVMKAEDGQSRGFGFVAFKEPEEAMTAIVALNGKEISQGRSLYVGLAQSKVDRQQVLKRMVARSNAFQEMNVYVKNLEWTIDDEQLRQAFAQFGNITSVKVMLDRGLSKGVGFVCFSTPEEAEKAIQAMNGKILGTRTLYVSLAQSKEERGTFLAAQPSHSVKPQAGHGLADFTDFTMPTPPPQHTLQQRPEGQAHPSVPRFPAPYMLWGNNVYRYQQPPMRFASPGNCANNMQGRAIRSTQNQMLEECQGSRWKEKHTQFNAS